MASLLSVNSIQGKRNYMEDRYAYLHKNFITIAMVCDGHGGSDVAESTSKELPLRLLHSLKNITLSRVQTAEKIRDIILAWGTEMKMRKSGSTISGILIKDNVMYVYNVGDSRVCTQLKPESYVYLLDPIFSKNDGLMINKVMIDYNCMDFFCTKDHDLCLSEVDRIHCSGGALIGDRLNGILNLSRTVGDGDVGKGLSFVPDIYWINMNNIIDKIVLYTDGVSEIESLDEKQIYNIAVANNAEYLVNYCYEKGSQDNITALILKI